MRLVAHGAGALQRAVELALPGALGIGADRDFDLVDHRFDLGAGFPHGLAGFARDQFGEGVVLLAHFVGEAADQFDAVGQRLRGPCGQATARACDRFVDVARRRRATARRRWRARTK